MLNLDAYSKFQKDIESNVLNIHPIVVIRSSPTIYLSQNEETLLVNNVQTTFIGNNLKVPSIKESIDLESRNLKTNNITITFSNDKSISDLFATQNFLNVEVEVYWRSQSARKLTDCPRLYKAVIKRVDHDYNNVKMILEDLSESILHKEVPVNFVSFENAYSSKYLNKTIPMVYG